MDVKLVYRKGNIHCYLRNATSQDSKTIEFTFEFCEWVLFVDDGEPSDGDYTTLEELKVTAEEFTPFYLMLLADGWTCEGQY